jgi:hypothetical protein
MDIMIHILAFLCLTPATMEDLGVVCNTLSSQDGFIYCAPFSGTSLYKRIHHDSLVPITFTDDQNVRIIAFHVTPFTMYLYNGLTIDKYYLASGETVPVYASRDIAAFVVTPWEELIIADRKRRELIFLDFAYAEKYREFDIPVKDMFMSGDELYVLTGQAVVVCDELYQDRQTIKSPGPCDRITDIDGNPAVFLTGTDSLSIFRTAWQMYALSHSIQDIICSDTTVYILGDDGSTLYSYSVSDFR